MTPQRQPLDGFDRVVVPFVTRVAATLLMLLMLLTCADVAARYLFNSPIHGGFELTETMMAALIFAGLPLVTLKGEHVTVDLFDQITPEWLFRIQHVAACLVGFVCTGFLSYRLWIKALHMDEAGDVTAQLKFEIAYLAYTMSILMAVTAVALLVLACRRPQRHFGEGGGA